MGVICIDFKLFTRDFHLIVYTGIRIHIHIFPIPIPIPILIPNPISIPISISIPIYIPISIPIPISHPTTILHPSFLLNRHLNEIYRDLCISIFVVDIPCTWFLLRESLP